MTDKETMINELKKYIRPEYHRIFKEMRYGLIRRLFNILNGRTK